VRIIWDEIPADGLFLRVDDASWVPGDVVVWQGPVVCEVSLKKEGVRVLLSGILRLPVVLECDRCLDTFTHALVDEFEVVFELQTKDAESGLALEYCCKSTDLDVVCLAEPVVDVSAVLAQQVYLALPEKKICSDTCLGLCPVCGANLRCCPCDCAGGADVSPFSILAKLKAH